MRFPDRPLDCSAACALFSDDHDRTLGLRERLALQRHLALCRDCSELREAFDVVLDGLKDLAGEPVRPRRPVLLWSLAASLALASTVGLLATLHSPAPERFRAQASAASERLAERQEKVLGEVRALGEAVGVRVKQATERARAYGRALEGRLS
jgi:hypothetical protein